MPSLPIPMISALVLSFFLIRLWVVDRRHGPFVVLLAMCAAQGLIISLAQHYGGSGGTHGAASDGQPHPAHGVGRVSEHGRAAVVMVRGAAFGRAACCGGSGSGAPPDA